MSEQTREECLEHEIARLTVALRNAHKDSMEMSIDRARAVKENAALRTALKAIADTGNDLALPVEAALVRIIDIANQAIAK